MAKRAQKVFVGLSGGVDSSVSAALLKERGFDVTGVFIRAWSPDWMPCTWREERRDAMRVAARLNIPFITLDLEKEYKRDVVDYMIAEYKAGRTPNPDVMCNKYIKFGSFFDFAMKEGADFIATGHYAQTKDGKLFKSKDKEKDQSYFLWTLTPAQLGKTLFPVGGLIKPQVRTLAKKFNLPTAFKKDSQGLCFIGKVNMKEFLNHYIPQKSGKVLNVAGKEIGIHDGAVYYTIGERHGFTISHKSPEDKPFYVTAKNLSANTITVSNSQETNKKGGGLPSETKSIELSSVNLIGGLESEKLEARIRYRQELEKCTLDFKNKQTKLIFKKNQPAMSLGQSAVIYDGERCVGGGIIETSGMVS